MTPLRALKKFGLAEEELCPHGFPLEHFGQAGLGEDPRRQDQGPLPEPSSLGRKGAVDVEFEPPRQFAHYVSGRLRQDGPKQ